MIMTKEPLIVPSILISNAEFLERKREYDEYYDKVRETRAYKRYQKQVEALHAGDIATVKKLAEEAKKQLADKDWDLAKPHFPDPDDQIKRKELGTTEYYEARVEEAKEEGRAVIGSTDLDREAEEILS